MQFTTSFLLTVLAALTTATATSNDNAWHIKDLSATCRDNECSYTFNIYGDTTTDLPGFGAQCLARTGPNDRTRRPCTLIDEADGVKGVNSYVALQPTGGAPNDGGELFVELEFTDGGKVQFWDAMKMGSYELFTDYLENFDVTPAYEKDH